MPQENFEKIIPIILRDEGGFTNDALDSGNWTGGAPNKGELNGTKFGISAHSYPNLDIKNLTKEQAIEIYRTDWWNRYHFGMLPAPLDMKVFDIGINMGAVPAIIQLQCLLPEIVADGIIGPITVAATNEVDMETLTTKYDNAIRAHYIYIADRNPRNMKYLAGWLARTTEVMPK